MLNYTQNEIIYYSDIICFYRSHRDINMTPDNYGLSHFNILKRVQIFSGIIFCQNPVLKGFS